MLSFFVGKIPLLSATVTAGASVVRVQGVVGTFIHIAHQPLRSEAFSGIDHLDGVLTCSGPTSG